MTLVQIFSANLFNGWDIIDSWRDCFIWSLFIIAIINHIFNQSILIHRRSIRLKLLPVENRSIRTLYELIHRGIFDLQQLLVNGLVAKTLFTSTSKIVRVWDGTLCLPITFRILLCPQTFLFDIRIITISRLVVRNVRIIDVLLEGTVDEIVSFRGSTTRFNGCKFKLALDLNTCVWFFLVSMSSLGGVVMRPLLPVSHLTRIASNHSTAEILHELWVIGHWRCWRRHTMSDSWYNFSVLVGNAIFNIMIADSFGFIFVVYNICIL